MQTARELPVFRLEIGTRPEHRDPRGEAVLESARRFLGVTAQRVRTRDVYRIAGDLSEADAKKVLAELVDPVLQRGELGRLDDGAFDSAVTVAYKPGVTDPVGKSAKVAVEDTLGRPLAEGSAVYTSTQYLFEGIGAAEAERVALELLANPLIQTARVEGHAEWAAGPVDVSVPRVESQAEPKAETVELPKDDAGLAALSKARLLSLTTTEMRAIRDHFQAAKKERAKHGLSASPTDVELECLAQTWSEHCKHKIFNATVEYEEPGKPKETIRSLFKQAIRGATETIDAEVREREGASWLVSVFHDNAGVVTFDDTSHLVYKVETHNSPSALDPYGGAITGIVGVNRDPFGTGLGADLSCNVWGYCFASPFFDGELPKGLLHPRRIRDGVHRGVIDGGNQSGIPYARGWEIFDARFLGKPLVFCGTVGVLPVTIAGGPGHEKGARPGDCIVMVGGRIGADGIHGATFSSAALDESAPIQAVQIGDPITQKRMFDFLLEARALGLYTAITDNGAGGLSSSIGEMAEKSGGARLELDKAPLKYAGLMPWEILISEAQERMSLSVAPERVEELLALAARREVEATVLGEFTDSGVFHVTHGDKTVAWIPMEFLHEGDPELVIPARWQPPSFSEPKAQPPEDLSEAFVAMVGRLNVCSNEAVARHYDHEVKGLTVVKPFVGVRANVPAEATVMMVRHGSFRGYVLSEGVNPFFSDIDTLAMAQSVVDEAVRRQICAGARLDRIAVLDNFCWPDPVEAPGNPDGAYKMAQLVRACRGLHDLCVAYRTPLISGKDSMKNDSTMGGVRISVPPTLLVSAIGQIDDVREALTLDPKAPGSLLYLLGVTRAETGGSEWLRYLGQLEGKTAGLGQPAPYVGRRVPGVDAKQTLPLYRVLAGARADGLVEALATPGKGGLGVCLARMAMAAGLGLDVELSGAPDLAALSPDVALFSESNGRFVASVRPEHREIFESRFSRHACHRIGEVTEAAQVVVKHAGKQLVEVGVSDLERAFTGTLGGA